MMKTDFDTARSRFINIAPVNPTQTTQNRFRRGPEAPLESGFTRSSRAYDEFGKNALKTRYTKFMDGGGGNV